MSLDDSGDLPLRRSFLGFTKAGLLLGLWVDRTELAHIVLELRQRARRDVEDWYAAREVDLQTVPIGSAAEMLDHDEGDRVAPEEDLLTPDDRRRGDHRLRRP